MEDIDNIHNEAMSGIDLILDNLWSNKPKNFIYNKPTSIDDIFDDIEDIRDDVF